MKWVLLLAELLTVGSAIVVAFHPNILYATIFLLFSFLGVAVMFLYAGADFLAGVQVIVYVGGVTILVLFAIMLTQWLYQIRLRDVRNKFFFPVLLILVGLAPFLYGAICTFTKTLPSLGVEALDKFTSTPKTNQK